MSVSKILGQLANAKGHNNEKKVVDACKNNLPKWIKDIRHGTPEEDCNGIDVVVETDVGKIFLQIKSSKGGKLDFLNGKHASKNILVIIVKEQDADATIRNKVLSIVGVARAKYLEDRAIEVENETF